MQQQQQQQPPNQWQGQQQQQVVYMASQPNPGVAFSATNPGAVSYYPQGVPQVVVGAQVIPYQPPKYDYVPQDFRTLTMLTIVFCGLFSPLSLIFSIPALLFANKSRESARKGATKVARSQGMVAAYFNIAAILFALLMAILMTGLVIGLYGETWAFNKCYRRAEERYGPLPSAVGNGNDYYSRRQYFSCT